MDESLRDAAQQGSVNALYALIQRDVKVLDRIDEIPFVDTPLHDAAYAGHTPFAMEIMRLKPSFARKLNQHGFTPMHLALQKFNELENYPNLQRNQTQLVYRLHEVDSDLVRVPGREGVTPVHYVTQMGYFDFLDKFSEDCPKSLEDVTIRRENVLHLALKYDKVKVFQHLLEWIRHACFKGASSWESKLLRWKDEEHNTLLHVAVSKKQPQVVSLLLDRGFVDLDAKNLEDHTVFDILERQAQAKVDNQRIWGMLMPRKHPARCLTALGYCSICLNNGLGYILKFHLVELILQRLVNFFQILVKCSVKIRRQQAVIKEERRNALLVVAALLITVTYQAALSPDNQPNEFNCAAPINATGANHYFNFTAQNPINATGANQYFNCSARFNASSSEVKLNRKLAGDLFLWSNTITFYLTNVTLFFLLPNGFLGFVLFALLLNLSIGYCLSTPVLSHPMLVNFGLVLILPVSFLPWLATIYTQSTPVNNFSSDI